MCFYNERVDITVDGSTPRPPEDTVVVTGGSARRREPPGTARCRTGMKRIVALVVLVVSALTPSVAGAGGWAVASLDPLSGVRAGQSVDVGFRLLQHGQTPVVASEWPDATIGLAVRAGGEEWFVAATMTGDPGHYVATVDVPADVEDIAVAVQMRNGLFVDEGWSALTVQAASGGAGGDGWVPTWTVPLFALVAIACAALIVVDLRATRRRRQRRGRTHPDGVNRRTVVAAIGLVLALSGLVLGALGAGRSSDAAAPALDGHALFVAKGCSSCHTGPDSTSSTNVGPPLVEAAGWAGSRRPGTDAAAYLAQSIREPAAFLSPARDGDARMPALTVTADEVDRLVNYLLER